MSAAMHIVAVGTHPPLAYFTAAERRRAQMRQADAAFRARRAAAYRAPYDPELDELTLLSEQVAHDPDATPPARYFELLAKSQGKMI